MADTTAQQATPLWDAWERSFLALGVEPPFQLFTRVVEAWAAPHRHYHGTQHLHDGLNLLARWTVNNPWPATVALAWFMHDVVYDPKRHDNEQRSALLAHEGLIAAGLAPGLVEAIDQLIMDTRHDARPQTPEGQLLVDVDLAILGASSLRYKEYTQQVRREYAHVPDDAFCQARLQVLEGFNSLLADASLFHTPAGQAELEAQARRNIEAEIAGLRALLR